jgi:hypothetical protein
MHPPALVFHSLSSCCERLSDVTHTDAASCVRCAQVLALMWTLLRQGPTGRPVARKVAVVAPVTLVNNWAKEVKKWLGSERLQCCLLTQGPDAAQKVGGAAEHLANAAAATSIAAAVRTGCFNHHCCHRPHAFLALLLLLLPLPSLPMSHQWGALGTTRSYLHPCIIYSRLLTLTSNPHCVGSTLLQMVQGIHS